MYPKFYIGPMSKNVVDAIIDFQHKNKIKIGLIPSRRQVDYNRGYVNNWTTEEFVNYVGGNLENPNIILQRDHAGPGQGSTWDDGYESLRNDCIAGLDIIHIDPWKEHQDYTEGLKATIDMIKFCDSINYNMNYEIGTEESIRKFTTEELENFIVDLNYGLGQELFEKILYVVIQCGTSLKGTNQTGTYDKNRLIEMINLCKKYKLMSKEHNGDYQSISSINEKFSLGLDAINIAPEFGVLETKCYLAYINRSDPYNYKNNKMFDEFFKICYNSRKWEKWVDKDFQPIKNQEKLIEICGHYVFSNPDFKKFRNEKMDEIIKLQIESKLKELYGL